MSRIMTDKVGALEFRQAIVLSAGDTLRDAARTLWLEDVGAAIVDDGDRPVGILSERDVVAEAARGGNLDELRVRDAMTQHFVSARPYETVQDAAYQMLERGIRHLPIEDDAGRVIGMVSIRDLLRPWIADQMQKHLAP